MSLVSCRCPMLKHIPWSHRGSQSQESSNLQDHHMRLGTVTLALLLFFHPPRSTSSRSLRGLIWEGDSLIRSVVSFMALDKERKREREKERKKETKRKHRYRTKDVSHLSPFGSSNPRLLFLEESFQYTRNKVA